MAGVFLLRFNSFCTFLQQAAIWKLELEGNFTQSQRTKFEVWSSLLREVGALQVKTLSEIFYQEESRGVSRLGSPDERSPVVVVFVSHPLSFLTWSRERSSPLTGYMSLIFLILAHQVTWLTLEMTANWGWLPGERCWMTPKRSFLLPACEIGRHNQKKIVELPDGRCQMVVVYLSCAFSPPFTPFRFFFFWVFFFFLPECEGAAPEPAVTPRSSVSCLAVRVK